MMRRNNRRRQFDIQNNRESNRIIVIAFFVTIIAILSFTVTFVVYRNYLNKQSKIAEIQKIADLNRENNLSSSEASSSIGKSINEVDEEDNEIKDEVKKIAINISNIEREDEEIEETVTGASEAENNVEEVEEPKEEKLPDPVFKKPVQGEIINGFAKDTLIYSNTLDEWITHMGIDIKADKTTVVKASSEGIVKSIKNDPRYGITIAIEHTNGYESIYSNLLTAEFVKEGEKVETEQTIGTVGNTAAFEIADSPHLHFEILKDGENVNPELYLK